MTRSKASTEYLFYELSPDGKTSQPLSGPESSPLRPRRSLRAMKPPHNRRPAYRIQESWKPTGKRLAYFMIKRCEWRPPYKVEGATLSNNLACCCWLCIDPNSHLTFCSINVYLGQTVLALLTVAVFASYACPSCLRTQTGHFKTLKSPMSSLKTSTTVSYWYIWILAASLPTF